MSSTSPGDEVKYGVSPRDETIEGALHVAWPLVTTVEAAEELEVRPIKGIVMGERKDEQVVEAPPCDPLASTQRKLKGSISKYNIPSSRGLYVER